MVNVCFLYSLHLLASSDKFKDKLNKMCTIKLLFFLKIFRCIIFYDHVFTSVFYILNDIYQVFYIVNDIYQDDKVDKLCKVYQYISYFKQREAIQNNLRKYGYSNRNPTALHTSMVTSGETRTLKILVLKKHNNFLPLKKTSMWRLCWKKQFSV